MTAHVATLQSLAELRHRAASRLGGIVGSQGAPVSASRALAVLHDLAASPETAPDALALLHELQVHQVELDLQAEALDESRAELEAALSRQIALYDALPVGCLTLDRAFVVRELNLAAAGMLGVARDEAIGLALDAFLTPECERAVRDAVARLDTGRTGATPVLQLIPTHGAPRRVRAHIGADPTGPGCQLVLADAGPAAD